MQLPAAGDRTWGAKGEPQMQYSVRFFLVRFSQSFATLSTIDH